MIRVDAFELQDVATGRFFTLRYLHEPGPSRYAPAWLDEWPTSGSPALPSASWYSQTNEELIERLLADFDGKPDAERVLWHVRIPVIMVFHWAVREGRQGWRSADPGFYEMVLRKIRRPVCECCGANPHRVGRRPRRAIQEVGDGTWRCEKHVGRNPCAIEGCGKTRASRHPASDSFLCGAHWRLAPHRLKLVYRRLWRLAKRNQRKHLGDRTGWTETLNERYWRNWRRMIVETRLIVHPPAVVAEILPSGPPPAALVAELERLGL